MKAIVTDYDGTIAEEGVVSSSTLKALQTWKMSGRKLILCTGRVLPDFKNCFSPLDLFDLLVLENGATIYDPKTDRERLLCASPNLDLVKTLRARGMDRYHLGKAIIATWVPFDVLVREEIEKQKLELQLIMNKGAAMILPKGVDKAFGAQFALEELKIFPKDAIGIGDAENDLPLLEFCGLGVAVANALPVLKAAADLVLDRPRGSGVEDLIQRVLTGQLNRLSDARA
jgi:HAD superfamily hydrolase (TIGR01484 family)